MKYISGEFALNVPCTLNTFGDWHREALKWDNIKFQESNNSIWENYGIELNKEIPHHAGKYNVANHIRALLDLLYQGNFAVAQGMKDDFICTDEYNDEIFDKVYKLKEISFFNWNNINAFMSKEYSTLWFKYLSERRNQSE